MLWQAGTRINLEKVSARKLLHRKRVESPLHMLFLSRAASGHIRIRSEVGDEWSSELSNSIDSLEKSLDFHHRTLVPSVCDSLRLRFVTIQINHY